MSNVQLVVIDQGEISLNLAVPGIQGPVGVGFPVAGGTIHQVLVKNSSAELDASWSSSLNISGVSLNEGTF